MRHSRSRLAKKRVLIAIQPTIRRAAKRLQSGTRLMQRSDRLGSIPATGRRINNRVPMIMHDHNLGGHDAGAVVSWMNSCRVAHNGSTSRAEPEVEHP